MWVALVLVLEAQELLGLAWVEEDSATVGRVYFVEGMLSEEHLLRMGSRRPGLAAWVRSLVVVWVGQW